MATRRCGYCQQTGHNRATCPVEKATVEAIRKQSPDSLIVRHYDRMQSMRREGRKRAVRNRKCSFCGRPGHNRRSCPSLKAAKRACYEANRRSRPAILEWMKTIGLAKGALMFAHVSKYDYEQRTYVYMPAQYIVTGINWGSLNFNYSLEWDIYDHIDAKCMLTGEKKFFPLPSEHHYANLIAAFKNGQTIRNAIVLGPAPNNPCPPKGWLDSKPSTANFAHRFYDAKWDIDSFQNAVMFTDAVTTDAWKEFIHNDS
jgi:ferredoxin